MNREAARSLLDVVDFCEELEELTRDISLSQFRSQRLLHLSTEGLLEIAGGAFNSAIRFDPSLKTTVPEGSSLIGIRNRLAYDYDNIRLDIIFETITQDIPEIRAKISKLLAKSGYWAR